MGKREFSPTRLVHSLIARVRTERGQQAEDHVEKSLKRLQEAELITDYWKTGKNEDQHLKIDFKALRRFDAVIVPIQVKSSVTGIRNHSETHPDVPCVQVLVGEKFEIIDRKLAEVITNYV